MLAGYSLVSARPVNSVDGFRLSSLSWSLMNSLSELAFPLTLLVRCKNFASGYQRRMRSSRLVFHVLTGVFSIAIKGSVFVRK